MGSVAQFTFTLIIFQTATTWSIGYSSTFMIPAKQRAPLLAVLATAALFFGFAGDGLGAYFTPDDMMNLYVAWASPLGTLARNDRPLGTLLYRVMFACFGLDPLPYRIVCFALLIANLVLLYQFCRRVSGSREIGALACLLGAYHAHLADLYYSTGTIYDLLCCLFFLLAFNRYLALREKGELSWRQAGGVLALYAGALASKEMAVMLPVYIALDEGREALRSRFLWMAAPLTAAYAVWKAAGPMSGNPAYALHPSLHGFLTGWKAYLHDLFYGYIDFSTLKLAALWLAMGALAVLVPRREVRLGFWIAMLGVLPFIFIAPRGFFVMYLVMPGWYLLGASVLVLLRVPLARLAGALAVRTEQLALFLLVLLLLVPLHQDEKPGGKSWVAGAHEQVRTLLETLEQRIPEMPPGGKVLFLSDPYDPDDWILTSTLRLRYRDKDLRVDRVKVDPALAGKAGEYAHVFTLDQRGMRVVR